MKSDQIRPFIAELAAKAGEVIRPLYFSPDLEVESKKDRTPVTMADRGAEEAMRALIRSRFPEHGIIAEEFGNENENAEWVWVLDPIDGTISFTAGCPLFGTLIGLLHGGRPVAGCIYQPILEQLMIGDGKETTLNGRPVKARSTAKLEDAFLLTTDITNVEKFQDMTTFARLRSRCGQFRTWGDCYGYLLVAAGGADIMCDPIMNPWDLLPLIPVVEGAGLRITEWGGKAITLKSNSCMAAAPLLHGRVMQILNGDSTFGL